MTSSSLPKQTANNKLRRPRDDFIPDEGRRGDEGVLDEWKFSRRIMEGKGDWQTHCGNVVTL